MARVFWTREARRDLSSIGRYLDQVAPERSGPVLSEIFDSVEGLAAFPRKGQRLGGRFDASFRQLIVRRYRVVYQIVTDTVYVRMILDGAMDADQRVRHLMSGP